MALLAMLLLAGCSRGGVASPQGDKAAAERAVAAEGRQQQAPSGAAPRREPSLLSGGDLGTAYYFMLENFVERVDYVGLIDAARGALRGAVAESGALPLDVAPLDLLPLATGNPDRDWSAFSATFDAVIQRHPGWALQARPDYAAIRKMLESLGDNHSSFLTADEARRRAETSYSGIGIRIARPDPQGPPVVVEVFASSPAAVAGIRAGDRILAVNDRQVIQSSLTEVADLIRGPQGTEVALLLERTAAGGPFTVRAFRRSIDTPVADGQLIEPRIGYIKIRTFTDTTPDRVGRLLLEQIQAQGQGQSQTQSGVQALILDLRGNPGGNLQAVQRVAGYFMESRPIGVSVDRSGERQALFAEQRPFRIRGNPPIVILVDGESGSGAEILAAAFKEYQLAMLVGQQTAGSVGIAQTRQLSDGSVVQVTVRRMLSASGTELNKVGVEPDVVVQLTAEDLEAGRDPQRDRAVQLLREYLSRP